MIAKIEKHGDKWILETLSWGYFEITSINAHCDAKLRAMNIGRICQSMLAANGMIMM